MAAAAHDICETLVALLVQPGVQEAQWRLAGGDQRVINKGKYAACERARGRRPTDDALGAVPEVGEVEGLGGEVGIATST